MSVREIQLPFVKGLKDGLRQQPGFIHVVLGPRQVGKTTGVKQLLRTMDSDRWRYFSADAPISKSPDWLYEKWVEVKSNTKTELIVIDEIQNIENWSSVLKQVWDEQAQKSKRLKVIVLGSSSLRLQQGLHESLAGRFISHVVYHWSFEESQRAYGLSFEDYLIYGGYPGSYALIQDKEGWINYIQHSIIDAVLSKDILLHARVKSPALFRQCFDIVSSYPAQEISYTKLLGQLQDKGNTDLIKNYLDHFAGGFLIKQLFKYSTKAVLRRTSSPKILPLCPALYSVNLDAELDATERGRCFELAVGMALLRLPGKLTYFRQGNAEVDYIYQYGKKLTAIEVKSGRKKSAKGLMQFKKSYRNAKLLIISPENFLDLPNLI